MNRHIMVLQVVIHISIVKLQYNEIKNIWVEIVYDKIERKGNFPNITTELAPNTMEYKETTLLMPQSNPKGYITPH